MRLGRVLVTGGTGFVGSALATSLFSAGYDVAVTSRSTFRTLEDQQEIPLGDDEQIVRLVTKWEPDTIFHLATHYVGAHQLRDIRDLVRANVRFGISIAEAATVTNAHLVYTASAWQRQEGRKVPASLYAALKECMSMLLDYYSASADLKFSQVFLYDSYGPRDPRNKLVSLLMRSAATNSPITLGTPSKLVNLSHVHDVVRGLQWVASQGPGVADWTVRADDFISLRDLVRMVEEVTRSTIEVRWDSKFDRKVEMLAPWMFGQQVPLANTMDLAVGLEETWRADWNRRDAR